MPRCSGRCCADRAAAVWPGSLRATGQAVCGWELREELGIEILAAYPWLVREFDYPHADVRLHFFRVRTWRGEPQGREAQAFAWQRVDALDVAPLLPAKARNCLCST